MHEQELAQSNYAPPHNSEAHEKLARKLWALVRGVEDARKKSDRYTEWKHAENALWKFHSTVDLSGLENDDRAIVTQLFEDMVHIPVAAGMIQTGLALTWGMYNVQRPVFDVSAREPSDYLASKLHQLKLDYEVDFKKILLNKMRQNYDAFTYGFGTVHVGYEKEHRKKTFWRYENVIDPITQMPTYVSTRSVGNVIGYEGNVLANVSPYNFGSDWRYPAWDIQKGTFVFHRYPDHLDGVLAKKWYRNLDVVKEKSNESASPRGTKYFSERQGEDRALQLSPTETRISEEDRFARHMELFEFQIKIVPKEHFKVETDYLETWQVTMTDSGVVVDARPLDNDHGMFTYCSQAAMPFENVTYPASLVEMLRPMQDEINWLINSHRVSVRRSINGWWVYNPMYLDESELKPARFAKYIKTKPNVPQGVPFENVIKQIDFGDATQRNIQDLGLFLESMKQATGITDLVQGVPVPGRRTASESTSLTQYAINRIQFYAGMMAVQSDSDLARQMVANNQQYMTKDMWMRLAGDMYAEIAQELSLAGKDLDHEYLRISPQELSGDFDFPTFNPTVPQGASPAKVEGTVRLFEALLRGLPAIMQGGYTVDFGEITKEFGKLMGNQNMSRIVQRMPMPPMGVPPMGAPV